MFMMMLSMFFSIVMVSAKDVRHGTRSGGFSQDTHAAEPRRVRHFFPTGELFSEIYFWHKGFSLFLGVERSRVMV